MGKYFGLVAIAALLLTGCASGEPEAVPSASATETTQAQVQARSIEVSDAEPEVTPEAEPGIPAGEEDRYLRGIKQSWRTELPSDEELLSVALQACEQMRGGTQPFELDLISGGTPEDDAWHSLRVGATASSTICQDAAPPL